MGINLTNLNNCHSLEAVHCVSEYVVLQVSAWQPRFRLFSTKLDLTLHVYTAVYTTECVRVRILTLTARGKPGAVVKAACLESRKPHSGLQV